jgi:hypothetical protein
MKTGVPRNAECELISRRNLVEVGLSDGAGTKELRELSVLVIPRRLPENFEMARTNVVQKKPPSSTGTFDDWYPRRVAALPKIKSIFFGTFCV